jgi:hypothetical protein
VRFTGLLLQESLADRSVLDRLHVTKVEKWKVGEAGLPGPAMWTATHFEGNVTDVDKTAEAISAAMVDSYWYANIHCLADEIVIFAGKVFRYPRGDAMARRAPEDYARSVGVPEHQIDWEQSAT